MTDDSSSQSRDLRLRWVLRLRWAAIAGYAVVFGVCRLVLGLPLPIGPLSVLLILAAVSQGVAWAAGRRLRMAPSRLIAGLLVFDTLLLTAVLYLTGGAHNPFSAIYLIQIAVAASLLGSAWTWTLLSLSVGSFAGLFWVYQPLAPAAAGSRFSPMSQHFVGMFVAMSLTGACLAWFVARLNIQLRERESALQEARLLAERESRFASVVTLAAGVAHELNSPLATIAVASRELEHDLAGGERHDELIADARLIRSEVERCRAILGRLRAEGAADTAEAASLFDAQSVIDAVADGLPESYRERLAIVMSDQARACRVPCAPLVQALGNLLRNAFEAPPSEARVSLEVTADRGMATFAVLDRGPGLPPAVVGRAGEPFVTTKEPGQGTGLGLFLVRRFADDIGGRFAIESSGERGTCARLEIPCGYRDHA